MIKLKNILLEQEETTDNMPDGYEDCFTEDNKLKSFDKLSKKCINRFYEYLMSQGSWQRKFASPFYNAGPDLFTDTNGVFSKFKDDSAMADSSTIAYDLTKLDKEQIKLLNVVKLAYGERSAAWVRGSKADGGFELLDADNGGWTSKPEGGGGGGDDDMAWWEYLVYGILAVYGTVAAINLISGFRKGGWAWAKQNKRKGLRWFIKMAVPGSAKGMEIIRKAVTKIQKNKADKNVNGLMDFLEDMGNPNGLVYNEMRAALKKKGGTSAVEREAVINKLAKSWKSARVVEAEYARLLDLLLDGFKNGRYSMDFVKRMLPRDTYLEMRPALEKYYKANKSLFQDLIAKNDIDTTPDTDINQMS
jgi:hypothetical protein